MNCHVFLKYLSPKFRYLAQHKKLRRVEQIYLLHHSLTSWYVFGSDIKHKEPHCSIGGPDYIPLFGNITDLY